MKSKFHTVVPILAAAAAAGFLAPLPAAGVDETPAGAVTQKSGFTLSRPTPRALMREMSTDRPDKTESPYTVDAGHFQFESDVFSFARDHDTAGGADVRATGWAIGAINMKAGLLNNVDLQLVVETYNRVRVEDRIAHITETRSGFGDITARLKINFWGNDGGKTAFALMPFVKLPTNQRGLGNDSVEGGLIVPLAVELSDGWGMGVMTEFDFVRNAADDGFTTSFVNTITFGHAITDKLGGYVEFFSEISAERGTPWVGTLDLGLTYALSDDVQLDVGINLGVTKSADDVNPFLGVSWRF